MQDIVRDEDRELKEIELRKLHIVSFNLPESESADPDQRKIDDEISLKSLFQNDVKLLNPVDIENPIMLGSKKLCKRPMTNIETEKPRPLRFKIGKFDEKRQILQGYSVLKNSKNDRVNKNFYMPQTRHVSNVNKLSSSEKHDDIVKWLTMKLI